MCIVCASPPQKSVHLALAVIRTISRSSLVSQCPATDTPRVDVRVPLVQCLPATVCGHSAIGPALPGSAHRMSPPLNSLWPSGRSVTGNVVRPAAHWAGVRWIRRHTAPTPTRHSLQGWRACCAQWAPESGAHAARIGREVSGGLAHVWRTSRARWARIRRGRPDPTRHECAVLVRCVLCW